MKYSCPCRENLGTGGDLPAKKAEGREEQGMWLREQGTSGTDHGRRTDPSPKAVRGFGTWGASLKHRVCIRGPSGGPRAHHSRTRCSLWSSFLDLLCSCSINTFLSFKAKSIFHHCLFGLNRKLRSHLQSSPPTPGKAIAYSAITTFMIQTCLDLRLVLSQWAHSYEGLCQLSFISKSQEEIKRQITQFKYGQKIWLDISLKMTYKWPTAHKMFNIICQ